MLLEKKEVHEDLIQKKARNAPFAVLTQEDVLLQSEQLHKFLSRFR
jgi:hypothetical protein